MNAMAGESVGLLAGFFVLVAVLGGITMLVRWYMYRELPLPQREVSKRRLGHMWVVDEDNIGYVHVVPKFPKQTDVQLYDDEAGSE